MGHIHEKFDFVITVFIVHAGKVLFVRHPRYDKWLPIGGHIELDEDPDQALYREIAEETGLDVEILSDKPGEAVEADNKFLYTPNYIEAHSANPPHRHISLNYFARSDSPDAVMSEEHTEMAWIGSDELESEAYSLTPPLHFYATKAIQAAGR